MKISYTGGLVALSLAAATLSAHAQTAEIQPSYRTALDGTFAPHAMPSLTGGVEGFNIDLGNLIAERLGTTIDEIRQWPPPAARLAGIDPTRNHEGREGHEGSNRR